MNKMYKKLILFSLLTSCTTINFSPIKTINHIDTQQSYRVLRELEKSYDDGNLIILMFSGGGTRAAALAYGVLEELNRQTITINSAKANFLEKVDLVFGVSGGAVLATYFALHGKNTIPSFYANFLKQNFQKQVIKEIFSSLSRLNSAEFGRGDILQEQFNSFLYKNSTFGDLAQKRLGPLAIISATNMNLGKKVIFTQEFFDRLCLDISNLEIARAVAASSAVPLVFAPITLNNNGGNCNFSLPEKLFPSALKEQNSAQNRALKRLQNEIIYYADSKSHPYIHLVDGGLTDNLGLSSLLDILNLSSRHQLYEDLRQYKQLKRIIVVSVNAQNETYSNIDKSANIPPTSEIVNTIINVPIDRNTEATLNNFRRFVEDWNKEMAKKPPKERIDWVFISLNLKDLPPSKLRNEVLNISTSFYLPEKEINKLREAARILLNNSMEYKKLINN